MKLRKVNRRSHPRGGRRDRRGLSASRLEDSRKIALLAAQAGLDKKASGVEIVDVSGKVDYADYLVLMTGQSDRHVAAIAQSVDDFLSRNGHAAISVEGLPKANWVLIDLVDVVVHVFLEEARSLYDLDGLWMDARRVPVPEGDGMRTLQGDRDAQDS
jgi:ribosome-associated protein